jgi:hypothetical protein
MWTDVAPRRRGLHRSAAQNATARTDDGSLRGSANGNLGLPVGLRFAPEPLLLGGRRFAPCLHLRSPLRPERHARAVRLRLVAVCLVAVGSLLAGGCASGGQAQTSLSSTSPPSAAASTQRSRHGRPRRQHHHRVAVHRHHHKRRRRHRHAARPVHVAGVPAVDVPNPALTPGAVLTTSAARVCVSGYSSSVRDVPDSEKEAVYARYGIPHVPYQHEVDHLVSLEVGGSNAITNLWPEPAGTARLARRIRALAAVGVSPGLSSLSGRAGVGDEPAKFARRIWLPLDDRSLFLRPGLQVCQQVVGRQ